MITAVDRLLINTYVDTTLGAYKNFMQIGSMPAIANIPIEISLDATHRQGYGVPASHFYDPETDAHTLKLWKDIHNPVAHADYLVYH